MGHGVMDLDQFDRWSGEFRSALTQFKQQEQSLHCVPTATGVADQEFLNECHSQLCATKALIELAGNLDCSGQLVGHAYVRNKSA